MTPLVSVCVPNLNKRSFLSERFESIFTQTFQDWELFVYDSYSDDGSWEFIQDFASKDSRVRIAQGPRQGPYPAWNECLRQTKGEYVYIATSDDSMSHDFLEKTVDALDAHPDCELAHCPLVVVDESGEKLADSPWPELTNFFLEGAPEFANIRHVRRCPYDGLLQSMGRHTVLSITQLLIRRSIFARVGQFPNRWGSISDFNWEMKAGLVANTIHVPDTWATWRYYPGSLTTAQNFWSIEYPRKIDEMIRDALSSCQSYLPPAVKGALIEELVEDASELRAYYRFLHRTHSVMSRRLFQLKQVCRGSSAMRREILGRFIGKPRTDNSATSIRIWLESLGLEPLRRCSPNSGSQ